MKLCPVFSQGKSQDMSVILEGPYHMLVIKIHGGIL